MDKKEKIIQMPQTVRQNGMNIPPETPADAQYMTVIDAEQLRRFDRALTDYKAGKSHLDRRVQSAERWWKLRNAYEEAKDTDSGDSDWGFRTKSAWLHNVITSKHADYIEAYPMPDIRARERGDKAEANVLSKIVPVILKQNRFERTYSEAGWHKFKFGTGVYKVMYDRKKNGRGDVSIKRRSVLNLFWQPGIEDIQDSRYFFDVEERELEDVIEEWPELKDMQLRSAIRPEEMPKDDVNPHRDLVSVVDCYYKKKGKLHYVKYVGDHVLYASEDDHEQTKEPDRDQATGKITAIHDRATDGYYEHGLYPYVFDALYPIEGSPAGYGYVDLCANAQTRIDEMGQALLENTMVSGTPRYFERQDGDINEEEFLNLKKKIVHVTGSLDELRIQPIVTAGLSGNNISFLQQTVQELRETSGNTETSTGTSSGVTAASAIAALQEASGKGSRDSTMGSYRAYEDIIYMVIELIRQFYDLPRQFRITGEMGQEEYVSFSNAAMQPQPLGVIGGIDMGYRIPEYDIDVVPEKNNKYTRMSQNELALQLYSAGFFIPANADQALACVDMMDFDSKDDVTQRIQTNGTLQQKLLQWQQLAMELANRFAPEMVPGLAQEITGEQMPMQSPGAPADVDLSAEERNEPGIVRKARQNAAEAAQPGGGSR